MVERRSQFDGTSTRQFRGVQGEYVCDRLCDPGGPSRSYWRSNVPVIDVGGTGKRYILLSVTEVPNSVPVETPGTKTGSKGLFVSVLFRVTTTEKKPSPNPHSPPVGSARCPSPSLHSVHVLDRYRSLLLGRLLVGTSGRGTRYQSLRV